MYAARWLISVLATLAGMSMAHAQGVVVWGLGGMGDPGMLGIRPVRPVYLSTSPYLGAYAGMPYCGYPVTRVSFFQPFPPLVAGQPGWLTLAAAQRNYLLEPELDTLLVFRRPRLEPLPVPAPLDPGAPASVFRPIYPEDRMRALQEAQPEMPPPVAAKKLKQPPPAPKVQLPRAEPKPLPGPPGPAALANLENARQIRLGREAFAGREYARAERRFQEAIAALPQDHLAYFLLAQARVALGKYQEAVASIQAGMRLQTNWPTALFWPRDLYESNGADYTEHLKRLADAQALYADDPVLLFLYGYELWFDDRREEARPLFQRAAAKSADPTFSHRFVPLVPRLPLLIW